ncbi:hypothetical protein [Bradyrhizobium sp. USDA 4451]
MNPIRPPSPDSAENAARQAIALPPQLAETMAENARLKTIAITVMLEIAALRERLTAAEE